jgi:subtilisin family serine protease
MPGYLIGAAPDASLILLRTENDSSETTREEMNWVAAAEYADSLGAQVFSTSLGYYDFDDGSDYSGKLDGKTALISLAAQIASEKGIVVVNSAGNRGTGGLSAPADAPGVIATGAIDRCGDLASFSSRGPSTDGRIKPDVVAMGKTNTYFHPDGSLRTGDGTSFSCPLVSGLAACLLQAAPQATAIQIRDAILQSGDRHANPDSEFGHGLPNAAQSLAFLNQTQSGNVDFGVVVYDYSLLAYPNPSSGSIYLAFQPSIINQTWNVAVLDLSGRTILNTEWKVPGSFGQMKLPTNLAPGRYWVIVSDPAKPNVNWRTAVEISD